MRYKYHPPLLVKKLFNDFIWETTNDKILLTFDDGPTELVTPKILNILKSNDIKAVFFCVGNNIKKKPELTNKILEDGHIIANHTMNHKRLTEMNREGASEEIKIFNQELEENFNFDVKYFRPPHGRFTLRTANLLNEFNMKCVMWNLLTYDFENNLDKVIYAIDNYLQKNSVIVFHDSIKCENIIEKSLNYTIERVLQNRFEFGEPLDCLK